MYYCTFIEGRKYDAGILADSHLLEELELNAYSPDGNPMCIYGDPAYPQRVHLQPPFRNAHPTQMMKEFNTRVSSVRVFVEWLFGDFGYFSLWILKKI